MSVVSAALLVGAILALLTAPLIDPWLEAKRTAATLTRRGTRCSACDQSVAQGSGT